MGYITTKEAAVRGGISDRMVLYLTWLIPKDADKPEDKRYRRESRAK